MRREALAEPVTERPAMGWGSDAIAELLSTLELPYVSLVPGASYRGLHDSLVNYLGNTEPSLVLCLHEEHAVAIAQGYAKVTGRPMAVALHSNVGLMHATMAIFNAYCDRVPMLVLGATGPVDAAARRPWIDWIHTAADQAALVRNYCKWDDQPGSVAAALESVMRAHLLTQAYPQAPTYVCLDAAMQEAPIEAPVRLASAERYAVPLPPAPSAEAVSQVVDAFRRARRPVVLVGRVGRSPESFDARVRLAERLGACVITDLKTPAAFPTRHPLHAAPTGAKLTDAAAGLIRQSDLLLSLDWIDLAGTLDAVFGGDGGPPVISCTGDAALHNGWSKDHFGLAAADVPITAHPDALVDAVLAATAGDVPVVRGDWPPRVESGDDAGVAGAGAGDAGAGDAGVGATDAVVASAGDADAGEIPMSELARALRDALAGRAVTYTDLPFGWQGTDVDIQGPLDYLGGNGGGGVGAGPGIAVGAALALDGSDRLPVAVLGDGDFLMGSSALWTAAHHRLPLLVVVANNRSYFNDEVHQHTMAIRRGRAVANRGVGQHLRDPAPDIAGLARSYGLAGHGPVHEAHDLKAVLDVAVGEAAEGKAVVVDVLVSPRGYPGTATQGRSPARS